MGLTSTEVMYANFTGRQATTTTHFTAISNGTNASHSAKTNQFFNGTVHRIFSSSGSRSREHSKDRDSASPSTAVQNCKSAGVPRVPTNTLLNVQIPNDAVTTTLVKSVSKVTLCDKAFVSSRTPYTNGVAACKSPAENPPTWQWIACEDLSAWLFGHEKPLLLDCRSFISFNLCHITGAVNIGCMDRLTKRRLQSGKIQFCDLIKCSELKEQFNLKSGADIVVYDDQTSDLDEGNESQDCGQAAMVIILNALMKLDKKVAYLKGGLNEFHSKYKNLCVLSKPPPDAPLYSPTTPIVSDEIDRAVASKVLSFMYIGNERDIANLELLQELNITHILNVTSNVQTHFEGQGFTYRRLPASDSGHQNLKQYFVEACEFIEGVRLSGGRVMIHCQAGVSRSSTIVIAYIMCHSNLTMNQAYKFVKSKRPIIAPNFNFMGQLMEFEQRLNDGSVERKTVPEVEAELS